MAKLEIEGDEWTRRKPLVVIVEPLDALNLNQSRSTGQQRCASSARSSEVAAARDFILAYSCSVDNAEIAKYKKRKHRLSA